MSPPFEKHIFVCMNERAPGHSRGCCSEKGASAVRARFKKLIVDAGLKGRVRANQAGCLDNCEQGVSVVVYPDGVWYGAVTLEDAEEIFKQHILADRPVERLRVDEPAPDPGDEAESRE